ncbi:glycosyltransferase [Bacteroidota bacterium]|nr:glycosyltransferase [Bacteroidota bacterium]
MARKVDISIVIVNYKVKEYVSNLLSSIRKAADEYSVQVFVVDNDSGDDSVTYLQQRHPDVSYIANKENLGFGKANNQAIKQAKGEFTLIINPDTLVSEDTFSTLISHMRSNPECGAAGCKILNPDGSFAPESKRSVPTIWAALTKLLGLHTLFPKSRLFGQYYLSWLTEDQQAQVPVLSGSFMFWRTDLLQQLGGFDERFFMYGEDIDLCYRVQDTSYHIDYVPSTSIIHYKGESTKKGDLRYIRIFNEAMYLFFDKHQSSRYSALFKAVIFSAIWLKTIFSFVFSRLKAISWIAADLVLLNISIILGFLIRFQFSVEIFSDLQSFQFLWVNLLASGIYLLIGALLGLYQHKNDSISTPLKALFFSYLGVAAITFFARNLAFSRLSLLIGFGVSVTLMIGLKLVQINARRNQTNAKGQIKKSKILLVGTQTDAKELIPKIHARPDWNVEVLGWVQTDHSFGENALENEQALAHQKAMPSSLGSLSQLEDLVKAYHADQVLFSLRTLSYKEMLRAISTLQGVSVQCKLIPDSMDFILGKSNVEYLESLPLVEVELALNKPVNRFIKRGFDLSLAIPCFALLWPLVLLAGIKRPNGQRFLEPLAKYKWHNRSLFLLGVLYGHYSWVGSILPVQKKYSKHSEEQEGGLKPGITGLVQLNQGKLQEGQDAEHYQLYYMQNYSLGMDMDILLKSIFQPLDNWE